MIQEAEEGDQDEQGHQVHHLSESQGAANESSDSGKDADEISTLASSETNADVVASSPQVANSENAGVGVSTEVSLENDKDAVSLHEEGKS